MDINPLTRTREQRIIYWKLFDRKRFAVLRRETRRVQRAIGTQISPVLKFLREEGPDEAVDHAKNLIEAEPVRKVFTELYTEVGVEFGESSFRGVKKTPLEIERFKQEDEFTRAVERYVAINALDRIEGITQTSLNSAIRIMQAGIAAGDGIDVIADRIAAQVGGVARATRIARTEIISASNLGSIEGVRATGLPAKKIWIPTQRKVLLIT